MRKASLVLTLVAGLAGGAFADGGPFEGQRVVRVAPRTAAELMAVSTIVTNVWSCRVGVGPIDVQVTPEQQAALEAMGLECEVRIADVQALVDAEAQQIREAHLDRDAAWFNTYRTMAEINSRMDALAAGSAGMASTFVVGNTLEGRPVRGIRFSGPDQPGNPRSSRPAALFAGGIHAREWVSPMTSMYIADRMIENYATDAQIRDIMDSVEIIVVPVQNVDGYEYTWASTNNRLWRKNRRNNGDGSFGVDLNRNFGYQWGGEGASATPNNDTFRGTGPFSEPETQIFRDFVIANPNIAVHIDFHSYSQLVLTPWGYTSALPLDADLYKRIDSTITSRIFSSHGVTYVGGPTYTTIYPASGGAHDWTYGAQDVLGLTIELRDTGTFGFVLPAAQILPTAEENFEGVLALADFARLPVLLSTPDGAVSDVQAGVPRELRLNIRPGTSTLAPNGAHLRARFGNSGEFGSYPMNAGSPFTGVLPNGFCGDTVQWYFEATGVDGRTVRLPPSAPATVYSAPITSSITAFSDDMETNRGWTGTTTGDTATSGLWARADPVGTAAQPENDTTVAGTLCWVTGPAGGGVGADDVDGGTTTLTSPVFSTVAPPGFRVSAVRLACSLWYSNNQGAAPNADSMPVQVSADGGATWVQVADVSTNVGAWWNFSARLDGAVSPSAATRVRFLARDLASGSIVEAAVDDLRIVLEGCRTADFTGDGGIDGDDVIAYFAAWDSATISADYTGDGGVDGDDVVLFFGLWDNNR